ncbi:PREDICTED: FAS-associated death domain protein-like [Mandrillus leucophaeus]|uniref:FAS-associated death domain protein-like n=1 Tax=Mandrillus leucophaeus TaxID=9568 RepID=UPI0005F4EA6A|nr:PREDICTED: FAS-associated death domain protein-like [Mandrillus leucophaeus]
MQMGTGGSERPRAPLQPSASWQHTILGPRSLARKVFYYWSLEYCGWGQGWGRAQWALRSEGTSCTTRPGNDTLVASHADLCAAFNVICDNVGKDWRRLARQLKVSDAKIDGIEDRYPRNLTERVRESLRVWKNTERENATVACLVAALRACQMNLVADLVQEVQQARDLQNRSGAMSPMSWNSDASTSEAS